MFGDSDAISSEQRRILKLQGALLSPQFLHKLVKARRACKGAHKAYLSVESKQTMEVPDLTEHGRMSTSMGIPVDYWEFTFPDILQFSISYRVPKLHYLDPFGVDRDFMDGFGQIECWINYEKKSDVWKEE